MKPAACGECTREAITYFGVNMKSEPLSYLSSENIGPWEIYLEQVDRVTPY